MPQPICDAPGPAEAPLSRGLTVVLLAALTLAGAALRIWPVASRPLWHDEVMTWVAVETGLRRILTWTHHYEHPPLSYLLVWISSRLAGHAEWVLRLPSLVCGIALVPAVFLLGRRIGGSAVGLVAAAMIAFDYNQIIQSQQARMYTLTALAVTLTLYALARALAPSPTTGPVTDLAGVDAPRAPASAWVLVGIGLAAAFAASHMGSFLWIALPMGIAGAILSGCLPRLTTMRAVVGVSIAYVTALLIDSVGLYVMLSRIGWFRDRSGSVPPGDRFAGLWNDVWHAYGGAVPALLVIALGVAGLITLLRQRHAMAWILLALVIVNAVFVLPVMPHGFEPRPRYVIVGQLPLAIGAAVLLATARAAAGRAAIAAALIFAAGWATYRSFEHGDHWRYHFGAVVQEIVAASDEAHRQVVFYPAWIEAVPGYYNLPATHTAPEDQAFGWGGRSAHAEATLDELDPRRPTWLIAAYLHTGAREWTPQKTQEIADRYGVAVDLAVAADLVQRHAIVVAHITPNGVQLRGYGRPER